MLCPCGKHFVDWAAVRDHQRDAPRRHPDFCRPCKRDFQDRAALDMHRAMSREHPHYCAPCKRDFGDADALARHRAASRAH